jgi:hypothetical protein
MSKRRVAVVIGAVAGALGAWIGLRLFLRGVRMALRIGRFWFLALTLRLYRRCPDCRRFHRYDARVCSRCGYRRRALPTRGRRARTIA